MKEEHLLSGELEPTNEPYAVAKIAGIKLCQAYNRQYGADFVSLMPTNLYGPGDNFNPETSHVLPALIRKFHEAKEHEEPTVTVWGTGEPRREFLHVDDLAEACSYLMNSPSTDEIVNVGVGKDISIKELADLVKEVVGYEGRIVYRHFHARRNPAQAAGREQATEARLAGQDPAEGGHRADVRLVHGVLPLRPKVLHVGQWFGRVLRRRSF